MAESGGVRFQQGSLDPRAEEFRPRNSNPSCQPPVPVAFSLPPPTVFYPYAALATPYIPAGGYPPYTAYVSAPPLPPPSYAATRTLVLTSVPEGVSEVTVRRDMEVFGEVRAVQMEMAREGIVSVHFYDLRHARRALREIREQHMLQKCRLRNHRVAECSPLPPPAPGLVGGHAVWVEYTIPAGNAIPDGQNQGTIIVFNLNPDVSPDVLREIFEPFGPVKEFRDTPYKKHQKFIEFYDVRDAARALNEMNGREIHGRSVVIEFSRPGGHIRKFHNAFAGNSLPAPPPPQFMYPLIVHNVPHASPNGNGASIEAGFGGLSLTYNKPYENQRDDRKKHGGKASSAASVKQQISKSCKPPWKGGRKVKKLDSRFVVSDDKVGDGETRTTLMIKNIPNKYSQKLFLNMLDAHCINCNEQIGEDDGSQPLSSYDFVYLPIDFNNKCNVGYGFVNMTSPAAARRLYKAFHLRHWEVFNSRKICQVTYARIQGLEALKEHFKNSKFPGETEHYLPVVFSPARDGKQLSEPVAIVGDRQASTQQSAVGEEEEDALMGGGGGSSIVSSGSCSYSQSSNGGENGDDETDGGLIYNKLRDRQKAVVDETRR